MTPDAFHRAPVEVSRCRMLPDGRMDRRNAAAYIGVSVKTLATWATQGKSPKYRLVGGRAFYFQADLDAFIAGENAK